jgi:hypothetical protein
VWCCRRANRWRLPSARCTRLDWCRPVLERAAWFRNLAVRFCNVIPADVPRVLPGATSRGPVWGSGVDGLRLARKGIVTPSGSSEREKLWSYADLITLRVVSWLRSPKGDGLVRGTSMAQVWAAFAELSDRKIDLWDDSRQPPSALFVERTGKIIVRNGTEAMSLDGQGRMRRCFRPTTSYSILGRWLRPISWRQRSDWRPTESQRNALGRHRG